MDAQTKNPVSFASVTLMNAADTSLVKGVMSDQNGDFKIESIAHGNYIVKVFFMTYNDWFSAPISINAGNLNVNLGQIPMTISAKMLQAAEVVFNKPLFEEKAGKTIMNVESHPTAAGDNVLELLKKMPGVTVDKDDNIAIQGRSGVTILIDDKRVYLSGDNLASLLKGLPAASVDKLEVIKKPSARYDAEGTGGMINIVMKKDQNKGVNGSVWAAAMYAKQFKGNGGANINARLGKVVLNGGYNFNYYPNKSGSNSEESFQFGDLHNKLTTNELDDERWNGKNLWAGHNINFGVDYYIDKKNSIGVTYRANLNDGSYKTNDAVRIYNNDIIDSSYRRIMDLDFKSYNHTVNVNYKHQFDSTNKALYIDLTYSNNDGNQNSTTTLDYFKQNFVGDIYRKDEKKRTAHPSSMQVATAKIDYEHPVNEEVKFEVGVKSSFVFNNNNNRNFHNGVELPEQSNHFKYRENINAAYLLFTASPTKKLSIEAGLRGEYSLIEGELLTTKEVNKQAYFDLFPSFELSYQLPKMNNLSFSYRNRIFRPNYEILNPYMRVSDEYNISTGNPLLKPEYSHNLAVNYSWMYMLFLSFDYTYAKGGHEEMVFVDPTTRIRLTRPDNIGESHQLGASLFARIPIGKWWVMSYNVNANFGENRLDYGNRTVRKNVFSTHLWTNQEFSFLKYFTLEINAFYMPARQTTFGTSKSKFMVGAGLKGSFLKKSLTVKLAVYDPFDLGGTWQESNIYPNGYNYAGEWRWESRTFQLQLTYNFGKQDMQPRFRKHSSNEEIDRMSGGGSGQGGQSGAGNSGNQGGKMN